MLHPRRRRDREGGQIIVLFELSLVVMLVCAALVIDLGVLRNNRQILVNTLDSAALAGGSVLPVNGATEGATANTLINETIQANYPGLPTSAYTIVYKCLIGVDILNQPRLSDVPSACNPTNALGHTPTTATEASDWSGAGLTRYSVCRPDLGDMCNVVVITGSSTTKYALAPVVGVGSGSTGTVVSAACNGPCGSSPVVPVDLVVILDRTGSMADGSNTTGAKIQALQTAAKAVLGVYDPTKQRVALALTGPGEVDAAGNPILDSCPSGGTAYGNADDGNFVPTTTLSGATTVVDSAATTLSAPKTSLGGPVTQLTVAMTTTSTTITVANAAAKTGFPTTYPFNILVDSEQMSVQSSPTTTTWKVSARNGSQHLVNAPISTPNYINNSVTTITVTSAAGFPTATPFYIQVDSEQMKVTSVSGTTWTVTRGQGGTTAAAHASGATAILVVTAASTTIGVAAKTGFPTTYPFTIKVDSEQMTVTGSPDTTLWNVTRTAGVAHNNGAAVSWDIDNNDPTIFVDSQVGFPTSFPFTIKVDSEEMSVTAAPTSTSWTVTRGFDTTTAAAHAGGAAIAMMVGKADTMIQIASAIGIPASGSFRILIGNEQMQATVSGIPTSTTVLTVTRGANSTTAATHNAGATVENLTSWVPDAASAGVWVPVGLSGTDSTPGAPDPNPNGALGTYEVAGTANTSSTIVKAINCISATSNGTTLAMPLAYAKWYLDTYGRPGVVKGILLETDGHPQDGGNFVSGLNLPQFTCTAAIAAATAAKAEGIKVYAVGYGISGTCGGDTPRNSSEANSGMSATTLLQTVATGTAAPYYFNAPSGADLAANFRSIAIDLARGGSHLVQLCPAPIITSVTPTNWTTSPLTTVTINGEYFTGANVAGGSVSLGGTTLAQASITVTNDGQISATPSVSGSGTVTVTTPCGTGSK